MGLGGGGVGPLALVVCTFAAGGARAASGVWDEFGVWVPAGAPAAGAVMAPSGDTISHDGSTLYFYRRDLTADIGFGRTYTRSGSTDTGSTIVSLHRGPAPDVVYALHADRSLRAYTITGTWSRAVFLSSVQLAAEPFDVVPAGNDLVMANGGNVTALPLTRAGGFDAGRVVGEYVVPAAEGTAVVSMAEADGGVVLCTDANVLVTVRRDGGGHMRGARAALLTTATGFSAADLVGAVPRVTARTHQGELFFQVLVRDRWAFLFEVDAAGAAVVRASRELLLPGPRAVAHDAVWVGDAFVVAWTHAERRGATASLTVAPLNAVGWWNATYTFPKYLQMSISYLTDIPAGAPPFRFLLDVDLRYHAGTESQMWGYYEVPATQQPPSRRGRRPPNKNEAKYIGVGIAFALLFAGILVYLRKRRSDRVRQEIIVAIRRERRERAQKAEEDAGPQITLLPCAYGEALNSLDPPTHMVCPIAQHVMGDPVTCGDGHHTFERCYLLRALMMRAECPLSRDSMTDADMVDNVALDDEILEWVAQQRAQHPDVAITIPAAKAARLAAAETAEPFDDAGASTPAPRHTEPVP